MVCGVCVSVLVCRHECRCFYWPEEGNGPTFPRARITGYCKLSSVGPGKKFQSSAGAAKILNYRALSPPPVFYFLKQMLCIVILSFILSLMFFKLKRLENCGFAQLDWLLVTISVNAISTVIKFDLSGLHEACVGK